MEGARGRTRLNSRNFAEVPLRGGGALGWVRACDRDGHATVGILGAWRVESVVTA
jgi:hypothetical protein